MVFSVKKEVGILVIIKKASKVALGGALCLSLIGGGGMVANAATPSDHVAVVQTAEASAPNLTAAQKLEVRMIQNLRVGQSHTLQGSSLTVTKTATGYSTIAGETNNVSARASARPTLF